MDSKASRKVIRTLLEVFPQCRAFSDTELQRRDEPCNMVRTTIQLLLTV